MTNLAHSELNQELSKNISNGIVLNVTMQDLQFTAYVIVAETNIEQVAEIVPYDEYLKYDNLHVSSIESPQNITQQLEDISFNMDFGDGLVLFCSDHENYKATILELGYKNTNIN